MSELALIESPSLRAQHADAGHVYVLEFASKRIKVGFTTDPEARISYHASSARAYGTPIVRQWVSPAHMEARSNEVRLLDFCREQTGEAAEREYFADVPYHDVIAFAASELPVTPIEDLAAYRAARKAEVRLFRARVLASHEARALRASNTRIAAALERANLVLALINEGNRTEATAVFFDAFQDVYREIPAPWASEDPTAAERYLIARGARPETAKRNAAEFELVMRTLYALQLQSEPLAFEDVARFCDLNTTGPDYALFGSES